MNVKSSVTSVITIAIAIILVVTIAVPVIGSLQGGTEQVTYTNDGAYFKLVGNDGTIHTITVSEDSGNYIVTTDGIQTRTLEMYTPVSYGIADAIGIGVYEAYNNSGVLTSMSDVSPTASQTIDTFRTQALAGNTDVSYGTYQLWNFYQYTLVDKIMSWIVMGNTDSQYMMGTGITSGTKTNTGTTSSAYQKSTSSSTAESLFIENGYGNVNEFVGDVSFSNRVMDAGNTLGGNAIASVERVNTTTITLPSTTSEYITQIYLDGDGFGVPKATSSSSTTAGAGINDRVYTNTGNTLLGVGGNWYNSGLAGLSCFTASYDFSYSNNYVGSRLAYVIPATGSVAADYGYVMTLDSTTQTTVTDVQVLENGSLVSKMPTGTTLNSFWDFDTATGIGPFGSYYAAINLSSGANADDSTETRLSTNKGEIAYLLDPNNLHKTMGGTTFTPSLYNVMLIIPTVYWPGSTVITLCKHSAALIKQTCIGIRQTTLCRYPHICSCKAQHCRQ